MLVKPTRGKVYLQGQELTDPDTNVDKMRTKIGFVFQHMRLFNHLTALKNVMIALTKVLGYSKEEAKKKAIKTLESMGMKPWLDHYPAELSGGQKQRVGLARALVTEPVVLLLDEPCSSLDPELTADILEILRNLAEKGTTMYIATHMMDFARDAADEMLFMEEGELLERGTPEYFFEGRCSERVENFLERITRGE